MSDQPLTNGSEKPNFYLLYQKVGEMSSDIKSIKADLASVCKTAEDAKKKADSIQNKTVGASIGIAILINIIGFFTDWFGLKNR